MKSVSKIALFLTTFLMLGTIVGVSATFDYAIEQPQPENAQLNIQMGVFNWVGAEELPEDSAAGENHIALIERIVNSEEGLNTPSSHLNEVIQQRIDQDKKTASSVAPTQGGNLKDLFNTSEMRELHFLLQFQPTLDGTVTEYYLYTFERAILGNTQYIEVTPVYKTLISLVNEQWKAMRSWTGKAQTIYYDAKQGGGKLMTIAPDTWFETPVKQNNT